MKYLLILGLIVGCGKFNRKDYACLKESPTKIRYQVWDNGLTKYKVLHWEGLFYLNANITDFDNLYIRCH